MNQQLETIRQSVVDGDAGLTRTSVRAAMDSAIRAEIIIEEGLLGGLRVMSDLWERLEVFLPEVMASAAAMKIGFEELKPALGSEGAGTGWRGTLVIGTVKGDVHDIGKNIVATMFMGAGFDVHDLGVDQTPSSFIDSAVAVKADIICLSSLLTSTMAIQRDVIDMLKSQGLRDKFLVLVGGAPTSEVWAEEIEADGWGSDAYSAVSVAQGLLSAKRGNN